MTDQAVKIIVRGVVQGVGFRYFVYQQARQLGLTGWTRNLPDGSVEVLAEGDNSLLEQLVQELKVGPRSAHVSAIEIEKIDSEETAGPTGRSDSFEIKGW